MKCLHCGKGHPADFKVCPYTAKPIETQFQYCKNEGCDFRSPLPLSAKFCPHCGTNLHKMEEPNSDECRFDEIGEFHSGYAVVKKDGLYGMISTNGIILISCVFNEIYPYSNGLCAVRTDEGWSFFNHDTTKRLFMPSDLEMGSFVGFCSGLCGVARYDDDFGMSYGYIDKCGSEVIPCQFDCIDDFDGDYAVITNYKEDLQYVIDKSWQIISEGWKYIQVFGNWAVCTDYRDLSIIKNFST